ncbi:MAG: V-type ATPase subunit, partial [Peptoniphilus harei]|nr:V-type ATPase subunit [Peptoniphilus harei]
NSEKLLHLSYIDEEEFEEEIKKSKYSILFADGRVIRTGRTSKRLMYSIANKNFRRTDGIGKFMSFLILLDSEIENIERILEATRFGLSKEEKLKYMIVDRKESEEVGR